MALASKSNARFIFRYALLVPQFGAVREHLSRPNMLALECFIRLLTEKLSRGARDVLSKAQVRYQKYEQLVASVSKQTAKSQRFKHPRRAAEAESVILKAVIDFELRANKKEIWTFSDGGLIQLNDDFLLLREYLSSYDGDLLNEQCERWQNYFLTAKEREDLKAVAEVDVKEKLFEILKPRVRPIWLFFVALCHALQEGEFELTPADAYWLGLIDEVVGATDLLTLRYLVEYEPDEAPAFVQTEVAGG